MWSPVSPRLRLAIVLSGVLVSGAASAEPLRVIAAENFYGDLAGQLGGSAVAVKSILSNPDQDPHLFESSPSTARDIGAARIAIYNGADYDPWMEKLLSAAKSADRIQIAVADLVGKKPGDNPHLWYDPATMPAAAKALAGALEKADPAHKADFAANLQKFDASLAPLRAKIDAMKKKYAGTPATASEPVFGYMASALGLEMRNERFQLAIMNSTEPRPSDVAAFERDLKDHKVKVMLYNAQASAPAPQRLLGIAKASGIPIVGVTETEPVGQTYQEWMTTQLDALDKALAAH